MRGGGGGGITVTNTVTTVVTVTNTVTTDESPRLGAGVGRVSRRGVVQPAHRRGPRARLAALSAKQIEFALHWTQVIAKSNSEMAYQFVAHAPRALTALGLEGARRWLLRALDIYDREGLYPGSAALKDIDAFARDYRLNEVAVALPEVQAVLERIVRGLAAGREIAAAADGRARTDTETLFLPPRIHRFDRREMNYRLYKTTAALLWAQTRFGTFRRPRPDAPHLVEQIAALGESIGDHGRVLRLF